MGKTLLRAGAVSIVGLAAALCIIRLNMQNSKLPTLKMALSIQGSFSKTKIDPVNVQTLNEANLVRNIYSRLVEFNQQGELVTSAAESFKIEDGKIIFSIRSDLKSSEGDIINAEVIYKSLKRLLVLDKNTHGDLKNIICRTNQKINMEDPCDGLYYKGQSLYIVPSEPNRIKYILPLLASVDFSIIPIQSIDWSTPDLPIKNYHNTSGAYFLSKDLTPDDRSFTFKANKESFYYSSEMPQEILIYSAIKDDAANLFIQKKIDFLPAAYSWNQSFLKNVPEGIHTHETYPIKLWAVRFTKQGLKRLSSNERAYIGEAFKKRFSKLHPEEIITPSNQMFPKLSEGGLTDLELEDLEAYQKKSQDSFSTTKKIKLGIPKGELDRFKTATSDLNWVEFVELVNAPWTLPIDQQPDFYVTFGDSSFFEDLSLVSNQMSMGTFNMTKEEGVLWMQQYLDTEDKSERLKLLRALHLDALKNSYIVPIGFTNFYSFSQDNWELNFSKYYVGNPFWLIRWKK